MTTISIHQPGYLPWLGFFKKIMCSDIFVFLDDVQYKRKFWHNRNKIRTSNGSTWLSIPVKTNFGSNINEVKIDNSTDWAKLHKKSILLNYKKAEHFEQFWKPIEEIYNKNYDLLIDVNMEFIYYIMKQFEINTKIIFSSELNIIKKGSDLILEICEQLNADAYISGIMGKDYLKLNDFANKKIKVEFQNFQHPTYKQCFEPFIPNMASIDIILNEGKKSSEILKSSSS